MQIISLPDDELDLRAANKFMDSTPPSTIAKFELDPKTGWIFREFGIQGTA